MFEQLLRPLNVNGMILRNRIIATPTGDAFDEKALGGAALVVAGHAIVEPGRSSFASEDEPWPFAKYEREATRKRVLKVHQAGSKASIEIFHGGRESRVRDYAKGPCSLTMPDGTKVRAMDEAMMQETLDWYSRTVASCRKIGFDAILLHFGHGWLPDQFLSPFYNHRSDEYGGSIENRARFPLRILEAVRDAVGPHYPVEMRISAYEWVEGSIEFPDVLAFSRMAERYVDMIQVSSGIDKNTVANVHCITTNLEPEMTNLGWARQVKRAVSIPVSVVGAFMTPQVAEEGHGGQARGHRSLPEVQQLLPHRLGPLERGMLRQPALPQRVLCPQGNRPCRHRPQRGHPWCGTRRHEGGHHRLRPWSPRDAGRTRGRAWRHAALHRTGEPQVGGGATPWPLQGPACQEGHPRDARLRGHARACARPRA